MKTATLVRALEWETDSALYRLSPPLPVGETEQEYVVLSALHPIDGVHGCIALAASPDADVKSWEPVAQSESANHADLLAQLGYQVAS